MDTIPDYVIRGLALVRQTGAVNMVMDWRGVVAALVELGEDDAADWCRANRQRYVEALHLLAAEEG